VRGRNSDVIRVLFMWQKNSEKNGKKMGSLLKMLMEVFASVISVYKMSIKK